MKQVSVTVGIDEDMYQVIERLADHSRRTVIDELAYIIAQAAVGQPVDPRPGVRKLGMVRYIRNRVEALDQ
ncbi:hypothetical protein [Cryocola sp. 340MFSha3.1]|jgi:hypothetical protein|uniref:hypothetical protein n=1 Tax=Cryocola sp. 340MFSha3.1 TaxID=1169145 RepID=UPI00037BC6E1|nr:hypothetical protein [Cryocola sp. 340MFSha3.1]